MGYIAYSRRCRKTVACTKSHPANFWVEPLCNKAARTITVLVLNKPLSQTNWKQGEICSEDIWITLFPEQNFILEVQEVSSYTESSLLLDMNVELTLFFPLRFVCQPCRPWERCTRSWAKTTSTCCLKPCPSSLSWWKVNVLVFVSWCLSNDTAMVWK